MPQHHATLLGLKSSRFIHPTVIVSSGRSLLEPRKLCDKENLFVYENSLKNKKSWKFVDLRIAPSCIFENNLFRSLSFSRSCLHFITINNRKTFSRFSGPFFIETSLVRSLSYVPVSRSQFIAPSSLPTCVKSIETETFRLVLAPPTLHDSWAQLKSREKEM